jgi:hypothetical protein
MSSEVTPLRRYAVFISYRHADNKDLGRKWANWLHEGLEHYEIPADLIGTTDLRFVISVQNSVQLENALRNLRRLHSVIRASRVMA